MKKIIPILSFSFLTGFSCLQAQNRPARELVDNPSYMESANDMLIAATDFGDIARYEREVIDESNMPLSRKAELLIKPDMAALGADERIITLIDSAYSYIGTPYKWAGTSRSGMDCSGFVSTAFSAINVPLSRSSLEMSTQGRDIPLSQAEVGDLLFFKTNRKRNRISHVGIVVGVGDEVKFIHASVSQGITVSTLSENYWQKAYAKTSRVLK
ncbi:C40 family peptidase [Capnocytophaga sp. oral taxon 863]|uniref:C40 family peptidase n=1 Tax=Capnocytophaga sp. oral taxon 863 TaxID=1227265 RepID=UPI0003FB5BBD|nr:C40 family peptidase [Capnocytophaga sp. oral taxon 863]